MPDGVATPNKAFPCEASDPAAVLELRRSFCDMCGMHKDDVIQKLRAHEAELRAEGISHVFLFGSVARGEAGENSDVDLFFDYDDPTFSLFDLMRVKRRVRELLRTRVDAMTRKSVHPLVRQEIEAEAVQVF